MPPLNHTTIEQKNFLSGTSGSPDGLAMILKNPYPVAELHHILTSPRGEFFRVKLLSHLRTPRSSEELRELKKTVGLEEYNRHVNKLIQLELIEEHVEKEKSMYIRTALGEQALNAVKELERDLGNEETKKIFNAQFRHNSIRLFLTVYNQNISPVITTRKSGERRLEVRYTPQQISHMTIFFQRTIDGIAAIDKLDSSGILEYREDGYVYFSGKKARAFYLYLKNLLVIALSLEVRKLGEQKSN